MKLDKMQIRKRIYAVLFKRDNGMDFDELARAVIHKNEVGEDLTENLNTLSYELDLMYKHGRVRRIPLRGSDLSIIDYIYELISVRDVEWF